MIIAFFLFTRSPITPAKGRKMSDGIVENIMNSPIIVPDPVNWRIKSGITIL
jgi:hypothetical protein